MRMVELFNSFMKSNKEVMKVRGSELAPDLAVFSAYADDAGMSYYNWLKKEEFVSSVRRIIDFYYDSYLPPAAGFFLYKAITEYLAKPIRDLSMLSEERRQGVEVQGLVESQLEIILFRTKVIEDDIFSTLEGRIASNQVALEGKFSERSFTLVRRSESS